VIGVNDDRVVKRQYYIEQGTAPVDECSASQISLDREEVYGGLDENKIGDSGNREK